MPPSESRETWCVEIFDGDIVVDAWMLVNRTTHEVETETVQDNERLSEELGRRLLWSARHVVRRVT